MKIVFTNKDFEIAIKNYIQSKLDSVITFGKVEWIWSRSAREISGEVEFDVLETIELNPVEEDTSNEESKYPIPEQEEKVTEVTEVTEVIEEEEITDTEENNEESVSVIYDSKHQQLSLFDDTEISEPISAKSKLDISDWDVFAN